jgi:hypothetical protein
MLLPLAAFANAITDFDTFVAQTKSGRSQFEQTVTDVRGRENSAGVTTSPRSRSWAMVRG